LAALLLATGVVLLLPGLCTLIFATNIGVLFDPEYWQFALLFLASLGGGTAFIWIAVRILTR